MGKWRCNYKTCTYKLRLVIKCFFPRTLFTKPMPTYVLHISNGTPLWAMNSWTRSYLEQWMIEPVHIWSTCIFWHTRKHLDNIAVLKEIFDLSNFDCVQVAVEIILEDQHMEWKPAGQPEHASLNQCQLIVANRCSGHPQQVVEIRFLCNVIDAGALIGPCSHVTSCCCLIC